MSTATVKAYELGRRKFLRSALVTGALALGERPLGLRAIAESVRPHTTQPYFPAQNEQSHALRHFAPVKVARDRLIREVVGLRPFRPAGFVVEPERLGDKLLVHNYGHGGAGVTLSWGTAALALDHAKDFIETGLLPQAVATRRARKPERRFAVLGCGVNGLSTARLLQRRYQNGAGTVTIYAKALPPETTSNIAGAFWYPSSVFEQERITPKFSDQFLRACQISNRAFQTLVGNEYGVRWTEIFEFVRNEATLDNELLGGSQLYPQTEIYRDTQKSTGFPFVRQYNTMMIEPHVYLAALLRDFYIAGGKVVVKEFHSRDEIARLPERVVFNCTGLGARTLFNDLELIPVRGQLEVLLPQPEIDYCYLSASGYMFPRRDGIILGGTWDHENWSLEPNPQQTTEIFERHAAIAKGLK